VDLIAAVDALTAGKVETSSRGRGESFDCDERSTPLPVGEAEMLRLWRKWKQVVAGSFTCSERSTLVPVGEAENAVDGNQAVDALLTEANCF
jgi:hypothetical protein